MEHMELISRIAEGSAAEAYSIPQDAGYRDRTPEAAGLTQAPTSSRFVCAVRTGLKLVKHSINMSIWFG